MLNNEMEGSARGLIQLVYRHLPGVIEENHDNLSQDCHVPGGHLSLHLWIREAGIAQSV
jgi:hypothetical protein